MIPHKTYHYFVTDNKSQFFSFVDAEKAVLDAAAYADYYGLWGASGNDSKATDDNSDDN